MKHWALVPLGSALLACTAILGNDFEVVEDAGGASGGNGAGATGGGGGQECPEGFVDCNGEPGDGCEAELAVDPDNCGACDYTCGTANVDSRACAAGVCTLVCTPGFGDCTTPEAPAADDGCETALGTPTDCAACGHDCGPETCTSSLCDPQTIYGTASNGSVRSMAIDANNVYWADRTIGYVFQAPLDGSTSLQLGGGILPMHIAVNATHVYFCEDGGLLSRVLIGGGGGGMIDSPVSTVAATADWIYYDNSAGMRRVPTSDIMATPELALPTEPTDIAVDGTMVYAATGSALRTYDETSGGNNLLYLAPSGSFQALSLDAENVYATSADGLTLYQGARNGGGIDPIASGTLIFGSASFGGWVYYTDRTANELRRVPVGGGESQPIVTSIQQPSAIVANASGVYFGTHNTGNIYRVSPPP